MQNVVVTGGAGFVGSYLTEALVMKGYKVIVVDNFSDAPRRNLRHIRSDYQLIEADVRDDQLYRKLRKVDIIFHLAANANVPRSVQEPLFDASTNILGTINMLNVARDCGAEFILASSAAVYGEPTTVPMSEEHRLHPVSPYGMSKLAAEHYVQLYRELYGVRNKIIRLFNVYGPRQRRFVVYDFTRKILSSEHEVVVLGSGRQVRSQIYASDAAHAFITVAERGEEQIYNVGSTNVLNVTELMQKMLAVFGIERNMRTTETSWDGDIQRLVPDVTRLQKLGFREKVSHEEGLSNYRDWYLNEFGESIAI